MGRKNFLRKGIVALGVAFIAPLGHSCKKEDQVNNESGMNTGSGSCAVSPTEEAGPFPSKTPSTLVNSDIRSDRKGVPLTVKITINNASNSCTALAGAIVDIWHCDAAGNYSEYGGSGMQSTDYTSVHFLRGRQTTDANGLVSFTSIFPGWYNGRAPHIHLHVYNATGSSLLITQIAFPTDICNTVYTTDTIDYTKGTQGTSNSSDHVFADSLASDLATVTGSVADGYLLTHLVSVAA